jgi:hypothetical protein
MKVDLLRIALLIGALASAYFAGYQRGRLVEFREREEP